MNLLEMTGTPIGSYAPDFELPGIDDKVHHLSRYLQKFRAVCVIFLSNHCPYVELYLDRLKQLQSEFQTQQVTLIGINVNNATQDFADSLGDMKSFAHRHRFNFPYLWDSTQDVTRSFGAEKIPAAFLVDRTGVLRYRGGIDDNAQDPEAVQVPYLRNATLALLEGRAITLASTEPVGGLLKWRN